jgi:hypothetical protein
MSGYYTDPALNFCTDQLAASAMATTGTISANVIDLGASPTLRDLGIRKMIVECIVTTAFAAVGNGGSELTSLNIKVQTDSAVGLDSSATTHASKDIAIAALTLGAKFFIELPVGQTYERYLGLLFTSTAEAGASGAMTCNLVTAVDSRQWFADSSSIA